MPDPRANLITDAVVARAQTLTNTQVFRGEIDADIATLPTSDRVGRHLIIYPSAGTDGPDPNLADTGGDLGYSFQVTCVAGFERDCEFLIDDVRAIYNRWTPTVAGLVFGTFRPPPGYQPGPLLRNDEVQPSRFWLSLQYRTTAVTTT